MKRNSVLALLAVLLFSHNTFADSPLTSIHFSKAYQDVRIVQLASKTDGKLTKKLMRYLVKSKKPLEVKIALIDQLGWDFDGKDNAGIFCQYLKGRYKFGDKEEFLKQSSGDLLICMAYLKALDNYFQVNEALAYARMAKSKKNKSYTVNIITAIIGTQKAMNSNWCKVYNLTNDVRINISLERDMKAEAVDIVFEYMDLFKHYCKE